MKRPVRRSRRSRSKRAFLARIALGLVAALLVTLGFSACDGYFTRDLTSVNAATPTWTAHPGKQHALHFLLHLLGRLATMGTAPAVDFTAYAKNLTP